MNKDESRCQNKLLPCFKVMLACRFISTISWGNKKDNSPRGASISFSYDARLTTNISENILNRGKLYKTKFTVVICHWITFRHFSELMNFKT